MGNPKGIDCLLGEAVREKRKRVSGNGYVVQQGRTGTSVEAEATV